MAAINVKITVQSNIKERMVEFKDLIILAAHTGMDQAADLTVSEAQNRVAVDTSNLAGAIQKWDESTKDIVDIKVGVDEDMAYYGKFVEWGTKPHPVPAYVLFGWVERHGMPQSAAYAIAAKIAKEGTKAQPFLMPAFEFAKPYVEELIREEFMKQIAAENSKGNSEIPMRLGWGLENPK